MTSRGRRRDERGSEATEVVIVTPVLLLLIMTIIQFGLWWHASHVAQAAAQEGVRAARVEAGSADDGQTRAAGFVATAAPTLLVDVHIDAHRDADTARVEIRGHVHAVIPGLSLPVHAVADAPGATGMVDALADYLWGHDRSGEEARL